MVQWGQMSHAGEGERELLGPPLLRVPLSRPPSHKCQAWKESLVCVAHSGLGQENVTEVLLSLH